MSIPGIGVSPFDTPPRQQRFLGGENPSIMGATQWLKSVACHGRSMAAADRSSMADLASNPPDTTHLPQSDQEEGKRVIARVQEVAGRKQWDPQLSPTCEGIAQALLARMVAEREGKKLGSARK